MAHSLVLSVVCVFCLTVTLPLESLSAAQKKRISKRRDTTFKIIYASREWNSNSENIDRAFLLIREKNGERLAKIELEETEPDSALFSGLFSIQWSAEQARRMQVFIPPQSQRLSTVKSPQEEERILSEWNTQIQKGELKPSPLFLRRDGSRLFVEVYDTQEQVSRARNLMRKGEPTSSLKVNDTKQQQLSQKGVTHQAVLDERALLLQKLAEEARERENIRIRQEQLERQKIEQFRREKESLSLFEQHKRSAKAQDWIQKGVQAYQQNDFLTAEDAFKKSLELDPNNKENHFMYGVSLYRNNKMNEALIALKISPKNKAHEDEKNYYIGLIHYRLQEFDLAILSFEEVKKSKDISLAASSSFYLGLIYLAQDKLDESKKEFEWVLDNSSDPTLDKKADEYLEKIALLMQIKKIAQQKWNIKADLGLHYDSNILFAPDNESSQGSATEKDGFRYHLSGDIDYRIFYKEHSELNLRLNSFYMYSFDSQFASADPFLVSLQMPYELKKAFNNPKLKLSLSPGYETLYMDTQDKGTRENIISTPFLKTELTRVNNENWFSNYVLEWRSEDSRIDGVKEDNLDAQKIALRTQQVFVIDKSKKKNFIALGGLHRAQAKGQNKKFNRFDIGAIYSFQFSPSKNWIGTAGLTTYWLDYYESLDHRQDTNLTFLVGANRSLQKNWTIGINGTYVNNASKVNSFEYNKYTLITSLSYQWSK